MFLNSGLGLHFVDGPSDARFGNLLLLVGVAISFFGLRHAD